MQNDIDSGRTAAKICLIGTRRANEQAVNLAERAIEGLSEQLESPKSKLQFELYKSTLTFEQFASQIATAFSGLVPTANNVTKSLNKFYYTTARLYYPRVVHLALYSKKARTRKKNKARLLRLMQNIAEEGFYELF